ncbi:MAG: succinate dehydrogenase/fumarate reductase iron-sulfur subunit [Dehalococcoidia bacterium]
METEATLRVFRLDPDADPEPHYDTFQVTVTEKMSVLEALFSILERQDPSLSFRYSCRGAVCGSCAVYINGSYRLACQTLIETLMGREIIVTPLPHLPVIKDLVVDMTPFYEKMTSVMPYLKTGAPAPEKEYHQSPKVRKALDEVTDCIWCACCHSACPLTWANKDYLGPAALTKVYRFVADSRDEAGAQRLQIVNREDGVWRCHTIFNCVEACPKNINQTEAIERLRRKTLTQRLKFW